MFPGNENSSGQIRIKKRRHNEQARRQKKEGSE